MNNKKLLFERMRLIGQMPINENINEGQGKGLISYLQDAYYQTGYFPLQNPDGSIRFIQNDEEFDAFVQKVQQSFSNIELPF